MATVASLNERITTHAVLACRGLRKTFGELVAVDDVGFEVGSGETYGLLEPNGAGKMTTISIVAGLLQRDAGEVLPRRPLDDDGRGEAQGFHRLRPAGAGDLSGSDGHGDPSVRRPSLRARRCRPQAPGRRGDLRSWNPHVASALVGGGLRCFE